MPRESRKMGRYPFTECINGYMPTEKGHITKGTFDTMFRRLMQIGKIFKHLKEEGTVSTDNPRKITPKDIDAFVGHRRFAGMKPATLLKDLACLAKLLSYYDNEAVAKFKTKFPAHVPKKFQKRSPPLEESVVQRILERAAEIPQTNWKMLQSYALVTLAICTGFRPKELQMLYAANVHTDGDYMEIFAVHVKGEGTYGTERWVTVHPDGVPILKKYLEARKLKLQQRGMIKEALFPPLTHKHKFLSYNRIRNLKNFVEEDIGEIFELRKCRRTFGQRALNEGHDIHNVSIVMSHQTLATTQRYYCDKEQHAASREMREIWKKQRKQEVL